MTREEFIEAVSILQQQFSEASDSEKNLSLETYLEALGAWVHDSPGYYTNRGETVPDVDWQPFIDALRAAQVYE